MMLELKLIEVDDSLGVILPAGLLDRWQLAVGDTVYLTDNAEGFCLSATEHESSVECNGA